MSSDSAKSILPNGNTREELRERFNRPIVDSGGDRNTPSRPPPAYSPPPAYTYLPSNRRRAPPPWNYSYPNMGPSRQPYPGPYPGYSGLRYSSTWPAPAAPSIAPTMMPNSPPGNPYGPHRMPPPPHGPGNAHVNPFIYLAHHSPRSAFTNYTAGQRGGHQHPPGYHQPASYQYPIGYPQAPSSQQDTSSQPSNLDERPEDMYFFTEQDLFRWMSDIYRPLAGVIGRIVQKELNLEERPKVKFELYPIRVDDYTEEPGIVPLTMSRGPMYQITLPVPSGSASASGGSSRSVDDLKRVRDALRDEFGVHPNAWHKLAGFVFRISRRDRAGANAAAKRSWVPPTCVYRFSRTQRCYVARHVTPALDDIKELENTFRHGDDSDDDQDDLVNEMWSDVRRRSYFAQAQAQNQGDDYM
ncbi:hypothetical protein F4811DRAFT_567029 [Daldinia bambusicola]|nr:hypothetical protein F4811DRAFT_567029 [Daldinia bambusicola]